MRALAKKILVLAVGAVLLGIVSWSKADSVNFSTSGAFTGADSFGFNLIAMATDTSTGLSSSSTLSFTPVGPLATPVQSFPGTTVLLGKFSLTYAFTGDQFGDAPPPDTFTSTGVNADRFDLTITQSEPAGHGLAFGLVSGSVNGGTSPVFISFSGNPVNIAGESYSIENVIMPLENVTPNQNGGSVTVNAELVAFLSGPAPAPPAVPLPGSVSMGLGLFGLMGVLSVVRRRSLRVGVFQNRI